MLFHCVLVEWRKLRYKQKMHCKLSGIEHLSIRILFETTELWEDCISET